MGKYNSSIYRVRPLMEYVRQDEKAFFTLLRLAGIAPLTKPTVYRYEGAEGGEMKLKPSKRHLSALIAYLSKKEHRSAMVSGKNRIELFYGTPDERAAACKRANAALDLGYDGLMANSRPWYMFEGFTSPDVFIEGEDYVIVCEGKWTEPHITTTTTYLSDAGEYRNQMIRHIQGALNYTKKRVYAFYIVDADCGYCDQLTKESFADQLKCETVKLGGAELEDITNSFFGFVTWQDIAKAIPEITFLNKKQIK